MPLIKAVAAELVQLNRWLGKRALGRCGQHTSVGKAKVRRESYERGCCCTE
eukprot:COSAG03_NODE_879_length_5501_cov_67.167345_3_plen_51_part_00